MKIFAAFHFAFAASSPRQPRLRFPDIAWAEPEAIQFRRDGQHSASCLSGTQAPAAITLRINFGLPAVVLEGRRMR